MACFNRLLQVISQFSYADHVLHVSSSASDVVLSNTVVAVANVYARVCYSKLYYCCGFSVALGT